MAKSFKPGLAAALASFLLRDGCRIYPKYGCGHALGSRRAAARQNPTERLLREGR